MKNFKILKKAVALAAVAAFAIAPLAGCTQCEHSFRWTVETPANCTNEGKERGLCSLCGEIRYREIAVDPNAHAYGDWQLTLPTYTAQGVAEKVCSLNAGHTLSVPLPAVTEAGTGYDYSQITKHATAAEEGSQSLVLNNDAGNIEFTVVIPKKKVETLADAVSLASSLGHTVRRSEGTFREAAGESALTHTFFAEFGEGYTHTYDTGNKTEYWYSYDSEGKPFGIFVNTTIDKADPQAEFKVSEENFKGFEYTSGESTSSFFGAEDGLRKLYQTAVDGMQTGECIGYKEDFLVNGDGTVDGSFSYSKYEKPNFCRYNVQFSLYATGAIKTLTVGTEIIRPYMIAEDASGEKVFYKEGDSYVDDKGVTQYYTPGDAVFALEYLTDRSTGAPLYERDREGKPVYEQVNSEGQVVYIFRDSDGKEVARRIVKDAVIEYMDGSVKKEYKVLTDPYINYGDLNITGFHIVYEDSDNVYDLTDVYVTDRNGMVIKDAKGNPIRKIMGQEGFPTRYYWDQHEEVSYKSVTFNQTLKAEGEPEPENPYPADSLFIHDIDVVKVTSNGIGRQVSDDSTLTVPSNTAVTFSFGNIQPTTATLDYDPLDVYIRDPSGRDIPLTLDYNNGSAYKIMGFYSTNSNEVTINSRYAGSDLKLVLVPRGKKCEKIVNLVFEKGAPSTISAQVYKYTVANGQASYQWQDVYGDTESALTVYAGQPFKVRAVASADEAAFADTSFTAEPDIGVTDLIFTEETWEGEQVYSAVAEKAGTYTVWLKYKKTGTTQGNGVNYTSFNVTVEEPPVLSEMFKNKSYTVNAYIKTGMGNPVRKTVTATFSFNENWRQGKILVQVGESTATYGYNVDRQTGEFTASWQSGVPQDTPTFDFSFAMDEAYSLLITHSIGFGDEKETLVLMPVEGGETA